jgi:hypothetical protein
MQEYTNSKESMVLSTPSIQTLRGVITRVTNAFFSATQARPRQFDQLVTEKTALRLPKQITQQSLLGGSKQPPTMPAEAALALRC